MKNNNTIIKLSDNLKLEVTKPISKRKLMLLEKLSTNDKFLYLHSIVSGKYTRITEVMYARREEKSAIDLLEIKKPNSIFDKFMKQFDPSSNKRPENVALGEWVGVEIECFIPFKSVNVPLNEDVRHDCACEYNSNTDELEYECQCCNGECNCGNTGDANTAMNKLKDRFKSAKIKNVTLKDDGSINEDDGHFSVEVCVLFNRNDKTTLKKVCALLNELDAKVNKSCGLHVHLDARDCTNTRQVTMRGKRLGNTLDVLTKMVPNSRRNNSYCRPTVGTMKGGRYHAVNMSAYRKFQTIEVRLHSATTDFTKIDNWVEILFKISRSKKLTNKKASTMAELVSYVELTDGEITYIASRIVKFGNNETEESSGLAA